MSDHHEEEEIKEAEESTDEMQKARKEFDHMLVQQRQMIFNPEPKSCTPIEKAGTD